MKRNVFLCILAVFMLPMMALASTDGTNAESEGDFVTWLLYQGHGSFRLSSSNGTVVYVDPYAGEGYDAPADIILVTHQHGDHNQVGLPARKENCVVITQAEAIVNGAHQVIKTHGITIEAVQAYNKNHDVKSSVGYIITMDDIKIYAAGDTSTTDQMATFPEKELSYALLPCDGVYNMDLEEAAACAALIGAKHNVPIHMLPGALFDRDRAEKFDAPNRLIVEAGEEIALAE